LTTRHCFIDKELKEKYGLPQANISRWVSPTGREQIVRVVAAGLRKHSRIPSRARNRRGRWPDMEVQLRTAFKKRRDAGHSVSARWITVTARKLFLQCYPQHPPTAFVASAGWRFRWCAREQISYRRVTNFCQTLVRDRLGLIRRFHHQLLFYLRGFAHLDSRYGIPLWARLNLDQVPLPFVLDTGRTYERVGEKRVAARQPGSGSLKKRQFTAQVLISPTEESVEIPVALLCRGTGKRISKIERASWCEDTPVYFQPKAWADGDFTVKWIRNTLIPTVSAIRAEHNVPDDFPFILFLDNLRSQCTPQVRKLLKKHHIYPFFLPKGCTSEVQPIDAGFGVQLKRLIGLLQCEWLLIDKNLERWESGTIPVSSLWLRAFSVFCVLPSC